MPQDFRGRSQEDQPGNEGQRKGAPPDRAADVEDSKKRQIKVFPEGLWAEGVSRCGEVKNTVKNMVKNGKSQEEIRKKVDFSCF